MIHIDQKKNKVHVEGESSEIILDLINAMYGLMTSAARISENVANNIGLQLVKALAMVFSRIEEDHDIEIDLDSAAEEELEAEEEEEGEEPEDEEDFDPMEALEELIRTAKKLADKKKGE